MLSQFSSNQVKMILTLVKSVIRAQNNVIRNKKMHFVKVMSILILPFGQGEFFPEINFRYGMTPRYMTHLNLLDKIRLI